MVDIHSESTLIEA